MISDRVAARKAQWKTPALSKYLGKLFTSSPSSEDPTEERIPFPRPVDQPAVMNQDPINIVGQYERAVEELTPPQPQPVSIPYRRGEEPAIVSTENIEAKPVRGVSEEIPENQSIKETKALVEHAKGLAEEEMKTSQEEGREPKSLGSLWEEALVTFAPVALTTLTGDIQVPSAKIGLAARKELLDRRKAEQERADKFKLAEMRYGKGAGRRAKTQQVTLFDPKTGMNIKGIFDPNTSQYYDAAGNVIKKPQAGYAPKIVEDALGRKVRVNPSDPNFQIENKIGQYAPEQQVALTAIRDRLDKNKVYLDARGRFEEAASAKELLLAGKLDGEGYKYNQIAGEAAKTSIARLAGEKGPLSDQDIAKFSGDKAFVSIVRRLGLKVTKGQPLTKTDRENLLQIVDIYEKVSSEKVNNAINTVVKSYGNQYKGLLDESDFQKVLNPFAVTYTPQEYKVKRTAVDKEQEEPSLLDKLIDISKDEGITEDDLEKMSIEELDQFLGI